MQKALEECDAATKGPGRTRCCHQKVANSAGAAEAAGTPLKPSYSLSKQFQNAVLAQRRTKSAAPDTRSPCQWLGSADIPMDPYIYISIYGSIPMDVCIYIFPYGSINIHMDPYIYIPLDPYISFGSIYILWIHIYIYVSLWIMDPYIYISKYFSGRFGGFMGPSTHLDP